MYIAVDNILLEEWRSPIKVRSKETMIKGHGFKKVGFYYVFHSNFFDIRNIMK